MKRKKRHTGLVVFTVVLLIIAIVAFSGYYVVKNEISGDVRDDNKISISIPKGASTTKVANILEENNVIGNSKIFRLYSKYVEADGKYQYGDFTVSPAWHYDKIINTLTTTKDKKETVKVTFPEGYNAFQMGEVLEKANICKKDEFIEALNTHTFEQEFLKEVSDDEKKLVKYEGFLFPDTYEFFADVTVDEIINTMFNTFAKKVYTEENRELLKKSGFTLEQWAIFASIIQKESANVEEMYNVSSVFTNRMSNEGEYPRLESCTTNNYYIDYIKPFYNNKPPQEVVDAYDTYSKNGLPIGAIANAGTDAFKAALKPNDTPYYFFVTDVEYTHYYGKTYQEHLKNIEKAKAINKKHGIDGLIS